MQSQNEELPLPGTMRYKVSDNLKESNNDLVFRQRLYSSEKAMTRILKGCQGILTILAFA